MNRRQALDLIRRGYPDARLVVSDCPESEDDEIDLGAGRAVQISATRDGLWFSGTYKTFDDAGNLDGVAHANGSTQPMHAVLEAYRLEQKYKPETSK